MNLVYSIATNGCDAYSRMLRLSVASVRLSNPAARITLVTDAVSWASLQERSDPALAEVDAVVSVATPEGTAEFRSRFVKTGLRSTVRGAFLYLDVDTLVRGPLDAVFGCDADIAGALNHSRDSFREQNWQGNERVLQAMNWPIGQTHYLNGGMLYHADTEAAHAFGRLWHQCWRESSDRLGVNFDQPALNHALHRSQVRVAVLPHRYNAQFMYSPAVAMDAVVWHYYALNGSDPITAYGLLLNRLEQGLEFVPAMVRPLVQCRHPWRRELWLDDLAARSVNGKLQLEDEDLLWFRGQRWASARLRMRRTLRRAVLLLPGGARILGARRRLGARAESGPATEADGPSR